MMATKKKKTKALPIPKEEKGAVPATTKRVIGVRKRTQAKNQGGRPEANIDEKLLIKLAESMLPVEHIAVILGCHRDTLHARFSDVIAKAREGRKQALSMQIWEKGLIEKDTKMLIWLSKQHLGYRDNTPIENHSIHLNITCVDVPTPEAMQRVAAPKEPTIIDIDPTGRNENM